MLLAFTHRAQAQTVFDSVLVAVDQSAPSAHLISNDNQILANVHCHSVKISNGSSHDLVFSTANFNCYGQYVERLDMTNIHVCIGSTLVGQISSWSITNNYWPMEFYFPAPIVVASHHSVVIDLKSDLYGWGSYNFSLEKMTATDLSTFESKTIYCSATGKDIVLANADHMILGLGVYPRGWNSTTDDSLYVLPGEYFYTSGWFSTSQANFIEKSISAFREIVNVSQNVSGFSNKDFSQPWADSLGELGHLTYDSTELSRGMVWTENSVQNGINGSGAAWFSGYNNMPLGEVGYINLYSEVVFSNPFCNTPQFQYTGRNRFVVSIDGVLGDFNGDGIVTSADADIMQEIYTHNGGFGDYYAYTKEGYNIGRCAILFNGAELLDIVLLRIWLNNPNDPMVKNLGIGKKMSLRIRPTSVAHSEIMSGNTIQVSTTGYAVRVSAMLPNGKMWSSSSTVNNGKATLTIPDGSLKYKVEAVKLPSSTTDIEDKMNLPKEFGLNQNYPNPFNPSTTISYSVPSNSPVTLKVYDVLGKEVTTLVDEVKAAGNYQVNFRASNLASGTYFYRITAGAFVQTKKMSLVK